MWDYLTNMSDENGIIYQQADLALSKYSVQASHLGEKFNTSNLSEKTKRILSKIVGQKQLVETEDLELSQIVADMGKPFGSTKVCLKDGRCENLEPGLEKIMAESTDCDLKLEVWKEWRRMVGQKNRPLYSQVFAP